MPDLAVETPLPPAIVGSLSPSRAAAFKACPLLYRFRTIDRLPETPSRAAVRGTVVHAVLEQLFDLPAGERTLGAARELLPEIWQRLAADEPAIAALFDAEESGGGDGDGGADGLSAWLTSASELLGNYFALEDPSRLEPVAREQLVEVVIDGLRLRGYIDRLDENDRGELRVVDYKTGATPREAFEAKALFQMKFYALVLWRTRGVVPAMLQLVYLGNGEMLRYVPDEADLRATERKVEAIWRAIRHAEESGDWRPQRTKLCAWCSFQDLCPEFGGTPPPLPDRVGGSGELTAEDLDVSVTAP